MGKAAKCECISWLLNCYGLQAKLFCVCRYLSLSLSVKPRTGTASLLKEYKKKQKLWHVLFGHFKKI